MTLDSSLEFWSDLKMPYVETRRACQSRICYKSHSHSTFSNEAKDFLFISFIIASKTVLCQDLYGRGGIVDWGFK